MQVLTEGEIRSAIVRNLGTTRIGDSIDIAMFYLSEREVIQALLAAAKRGVAVRVILDPNKDAFGREKNGIPNRSVATELAAASDGAIKVRWFRTHGEQFHSKLVAMRTATEFWFTLGSANLTRRNLGRLQSRGQPRRERAAERGDRRVRSPPGSTRCGPTAARPTSSTPRTFGTYADPAQGTYWLYRIMEGTGPIDLLRLPGRCGLCCDRGRGLSLELGRRR